MRLRHGVELIKIHGLNILAVHPLKLYHIKHGRGFADILIIKFLHQLVQGKNLLIALRRPAKKCHKVHHRLRHKALVNQILIGGMAAALAQLLVLLIRDRRTVDIRRNLPAKRLIKTVILRRGRQIFISPHHMRDPLQVIIHHIGKIVRGEAVGL